MNKIDLFLSSAMQQPPLLDVPPTHRIIRIPVEPDCLVHRLLDLKRPNWSRDDRL